MIQGQYDIDEYQTKEIIACEKRKINQSIEKDEWNVSSCENVLNNDSE